MAAVEMAGGLASSEVLGLSPIMARSGQGRFGRLVHPATHWFITCAAAVCGGGVPKEDSWLFASGSTGLAA